MSIFNMSFEDIFGSENWKQNYKNLVDLVLSKNLESLLDKRLTFSPYGTYKVSIIKDPSYLEFISNLTLLNSVFKEFVNLKKIPREKLHTINGFLSMFSKNITVNQGLELNYVYIGWMYFYDDLVTETFQKCHKNSREIVNIFNEIQKDALISGLEGKVFSYNKNRCNHLLESVHSLGLSLNRFAQGLRKKDINSDRFEKEFNNYLNSLTLQAESAPETPEAYLNQHCNSGGARSCLILNMLLVGSDDTKSSKYDLAISQANHLILRMNDAMAAKDIGKAEELYISTIISSMVAKEVWNLSKPLQHGTILKTHGGNEIGFNAMKRIHSEIKIYFSYLFESTEETCECKSILKWVMGYFLTNPSSHRYGRSFEVYRAAVLEDYEGYKNLFQGMMKSDHQLNH